MPLNGLDATAICMQVQCALSVGLVWEFVQFEPSSTHYFKVCALQNASDLKGPNVIRWFTQANCSELTWQFWVK